MWSRSQISFIFQMDNQLSPHHLLKTYTFAFTLPNNHNKFHVFMGPFVISLFYSCNLFPTHMPIYLLGRATQREKKNVCLHRSNSKTDSWAKRNIGIKEIRKCTQIRFFYFFFLLGDYSNSWTCGLKSFIYFRKFSAVTSPNMASATFSLTNFC